jgi:DNA (cytosine-5)-methyltransferase 1
VWLSNVAKDLEPVLPTPTVSDNRGAAKGEVANGNPKSRLKVEVELLPTTRTSMSNGPTRKEIAEGNPKTRLETEVMLGETNWGKFEPAIRRWEEVLGRIAPAPTKPDGKDDAHRLSSLFTEWLMGLPEGWITDVGLTRNEELKACGNGVVPQQAELALRTLLEGVALPTGERD